MSKKELALQITTAMHKGKSKIESFNAYQCIKGYLLDLEVEDLVGVATRYGINAIDSEIIQVDKLDEYTYFMLGVKSK